MQKHIDVISNTLSVVFGSYALTNIKETLSIIILVLSIVNILITMGCKIYAKIKNNKYEEIPNDIQDGIDALDKLDKNINEKEGKK